MSIRRISIVMWCIAVVLFIYQAVDLIIYGNMMRVELCLLIVTGVLLIR